MPRGKRRKSSTGIYHIMMRGNNKEDIFLDEIDRNMFLGILFDVAEDSQIFVHAYCLMTNHIHLLLEESEEMSISVAVKRIALKFVSWYNKKYKRIGHLFQGRFRSEAIEDEGYYKTVMRYIHQNPVKAKIVNQTSNYQWSSMKRIIDSYNIPVNGLETDYIHTFWPDCNKMVEFMEHKCNTVCIDVDDRKLAEEQMMDYIIESYNLERFDILSRNDRNELIRTINSENNVSVKLMSIIFGISRSTIIRILK